jgi:hypothetical protein
MSERGMRDAHAGRKHWWFPAAALARPFLPSVRRAGYDIRDPDVLLRVEVQVLYAIMAGISALLYAYVQLSAGSPLLIGLFVALALGNGLLLVGLRRTGQLRLASHATLLLALLTIGLATYLTGGLRLTNGARLGRALHPCATRVPARG